MPDPRASSCNSGSPGAKVRCVRNRLTLLLLAVLALTPLAVSAQSLDGFGPSAQDRYNKRQRGVASIDEYVRDLSSENPDERLLAVRNLGESKDEKAVEYLVQAVGDSDPRVSAKAIDMLGHMRATEATPVLIQYLFLRTTDPQVKSLILAALGKIGDDRAARPITEFLQRDLDKSTKGTAIFALGEIGSTDAEGALSWAAANDTDRTVRRLANEALIKVQSRRESLSAEAKQPAETFLKRDQQQEQQ
jgi:HEAT repeat protein